MGIAQQIRSKGSLERVVEKKAPKKTVVPIRAAKGQEALAIDVVGPALYGEQWHSVMARELGVSRPTLYKMVEKGVGLTPGQDERFRKLLVARRDHLNEVLGE